jgi:hypothetical protein
MRRRPPLQSRSELQQWSETFACPTVLLDEGFWRGGLSLTGGRDPRPPVRDMPSAKTLSDWRVSTVVSPLRQVRGRLDTVIG